MGSGTISTRPSCTPFHTIPRITSTPFMYSCGMRDLYNEEHWGMNTAAKYSNRGNPCQARTDSIRLVTSA